MYKQILCLGLVAASAHAARIPSLIFSDNKAFLHAIAVQLDKLNKAFEQHGLGVVVHNHGNGITPVNTASMNIVQEGSAFAAAPAVPGAQELQGPESAGFLSYLKSFFWGGSKPIAPRKPTFTGYVWANKREIVTKAALAGYLYSNYQLVTLGSYLHAPERWSLWLPAASLTALLAADVATVRHDLLAEMHKRYGSQDRERFIAELDVETAALHKYVRLVNMLVAADMLKTRCFAACAACMPKVFGVSLGFGLNMLAGQIQVKTLFFVDDALFQQAKERMARLAYLKNLGCAQPLRVQLSF